MSLVLSSLGLLYVALGVFAAMLVPMALVAARSCRRSELALPLGVAVLLVIWFAAVSALATAGAFQTAVGGVPTIAFAVAIPVALGFGAVRLIEPVGRAFAMRDLQPLLIAMQSYRVFGLGFIVLMALGQLPAIFAIPAGLGDFAIGLTAFGAASAVRDGQLARGFWWNVMGLVDLGIALMLGVGTGPSQLGFIPTMPRNTLFSLAPFAIVPSFFVPLDITLHLLSLRGLAERRMQPAADQPVVQLAAA
jgi:hypothetical protein